MNKQQKQEVFEKSGINWESNCEMYATMIQHRIEVFPNATGMMINADIRQCSWNFNDSDYSNVLHWSDKALELVDTTKRVKHNEFVEEHGVPVKTMCQMILSLEENTVEAIKDILVNFSAPTIITKEEDALLSAAKLNTKMPADWDGIDHFARYNAVGINVVNNPNGRK